MTQSSLAQTLGVSTALIGFIEMGTTTKPYRLSIAIATRLASIGHDPFQAIPGFKPGTGKGKGKNPVSETYVQKRRERIPVVEEKAHDLFQKAKLLITRAILLIDKDINLEEVEAERHMVCLQKLKDKKTELISTLKGEIPKEWLHQS